MMIIMTLVNQGIPKEGVTIFRIDNLAGGVLIFGQTFVMLFTALQVATDRGNSFLIRLYASPMKSRDFTNGYIFPMILVAILQALITNTAAFIISLIVGTKISILGLILSVFTALPSAVLFISIGLIFGTLFNEKAAPGICSVIISLSSFVGGIWFDAESVKGVLHTICLCLPFLYCTRMVRSTITLDFGWEAFFLPMIIVVMSAVVLVFLAILLFRRKMKADLG
jgi:ABC-2 type transport system permease protein